MFQSCWDMIVEIQKSEYLEIPNSNDLNFIPIV